MPRAPPCWRTTPIRNVEMPPPQIAITISAEISFALSGRRSIARPMHMPKAFANPMATQLRKDVFGPVASSRGIFAQNSQAAAPAARSP